MTDELQGQGRNRDRRQHRASARRWCWPWPSRARRSSSTTSPTQQATEELERKLAGLGETAAVGVEADVSKVEDLQRMIDTAVSIFGRLDVMVNNAGIETRTSVLDTTEAQYEKVMAVNLKSAFFGTQLAAKQMIAQGGGGRIINMTSVHEDWPMPGNTAYCLSKGGMRMLTRTAGVELAPHNICVVGVGPGAVNTPINAQTVTDPAALAKLNSCHPASAAWPSPRRSPRWWPSWPATGPATSRPPRSSPTAASCRAAPGSDRSRARRQPDRRAPRSYDGRWVRTLPRLAAMPAGMRRPGPLRLHPRHREPLPEDVVAPRPGR